MTLPETSSDLRAARKIATDYQDRKLFKCVFERSLSGKNLSKNRLDEIKQKIAMKSRNQPKPNFHRHIHNIVHSAYTIQKGIQVDHPYQKGWQKI